VHSLALHFCFVLRHHSPIYVCAYEKQRSQSFLHFSCYSPSYFLEKHKKSGRSSSSIIIIIIIIIIIKVATLVVALAASSRQQQSIDIMGNTQSGEQLLEAAMEGDLTTVQRLVQHSRVDVNYQNQVTEHASLCMSALCYCNIAAYLHERTGETMSSLIFNELL